MGKDLDAGGGGGRDGAGAQADGRGAAEMRKGQGLKPTGGARLKCGALWAQKERPAGGRSFFYTIISDVHSATNISESGAFLRTESTPFLQLDFAV